MRFKTVFLAFLLFLVPLVCFPADQRIQYNEYMTGANHPTKADTLNRLIVVEHNNDGTHKGIALGVVDALNDYGSGTSYTSTAINAAISAIGSGTANILIRPGEWTITAPVTFTEKIQPIMAGGAYFTLSGAGSVAGMKEATPEMFALHTTPGTTDMGPAAAAASLAAAKVKLSATTYRMNSGKITPRNGLTIEGSGYTTVVNWYGTGFWIDNNTTDSISLFSVSNLTYNDKTANSLGFLRLGDKTSSFSDANWKRLYMHNVAANGYAPGGAITSGTRCLELAQVNRSNVSNITCEDFDIPYEFSPVDESRIDNIESQRFKTYSLYYHNDMTSYTPPVADETVITRVGILEVPSTATAAVFIKSVSNLRMEAVFQEPAGSPGIPVAFKMTDVIHSSIKGVTLGTATKAFECTDCYDVEIHSAGMQNPADLTATSTFTWTAGRRFGGYRYYGGVKFFGCDYAINQQVAGIPGVAVFGADADGGLSLHGGELGGVSNLYNGQILDRVGNVSLRETDLVISPHSSNKFLYATSMAAIEAVPDANASRGYALTVAELAGGLVGFKIPFPANIIAGDYELVVRARWATAGATKEAFYLYYNGGVVTSTDVTVNTAYKVYKARFNYAPSGATDTLYAMIGTEKAPFIDYMILRPAQNSEFSQIYTAADTDIWSTGGFKDVRLPSAPTTGSWAISDKVWNSNATPGQPIGWICTTPGAAGVFVFSPMANL